MKPGWYELDTGRHVWLEQLHLQLSSIGILEGHPDWVRARVLAGIGAAVGRHFAPDPVWFLHPPADGPLPRYLLMAEYHSPRPVAAGAAMSYLIVCWFQDDTVLDDGRIGERVRGVAWDSLARDGDW